LVEKRDSHAEIRVRDNGIGIAPEMLPKVFDLFAQASSSAGRSEGGLGIGLTLASRLVGMHGGTLHAFSKGIGQGSEFVVHLPLLSDAGDGSDVPAGSEEPCPTARRILVVDDHRDAAESLAILLRLRGHEVREEYEGSEALNAALDFHPDVVFLDIGLPGMSGYEVATRIREDARLKGIRLVALSGYGSEDHRRQCKAVGFDALLVKPVELASIEHALAAQASSDDAWR
jgi:CheY-like chemotaxis protein